MWSRRHSWILLAESIISYADLAPLTLGRLSRTTLRSRGRIVFKAILHAWCRGWCLIYTHTLAMNYLEPRQQHMMSVVTYWDETSTSWTSLSRTFGTLSEGTHVHPNFCGVDVAEGCGGLWAFSHCAKAVVAGAIPLFEYDRGVGTSFVSICANDDVDLLCNDSSEKEAKDGTELD